MVIDLYITIRGYSFAKKSINRITRRRHINRSPFAKQLWLNFITTKGLSTSWRQGEDMQTCTRLCRWLVHAPVFRHLRISALSGSISPWDYYASLLVTIIIAKTIYCVTVSLRVAPFPFGPKNTSRHVGQKGISSCQWKTSLQSNIIVYHLINWHIYPTYLWTEYLAMFQHSVASCFVLFDWSHLCAC